jgi:hypothetical protein
MSDNNTEGVYSSNISNMVLLKSQLIHGEVKSGHLTAGLRASRKILQPPTSSNFDF